MGNACVGLSKFDFPVTREPHVVRSHFPKFSSVQTWVPLYVTIIASLLTSHRDFSACYYAPGRVHYYSEISVPVPVD